MSRRGFKKNRRELLVTETHLGILMLALGLFYWALKLQLDAIWGTLDQIRRILENQTSCS